MPVVHRLQLLAFAALTFFLAPLRIKASLVGHLTTNPAGVYLLRKYLGEAFCCALHSTCGAHCAQHAGCMPQQCSRRDCIRV